MNLENIYFGKIKLDNETKAIRSKGLYEYVNLLNPPKKQRPYVNYRLLIQLCKIFKENRIQIVIKKLIDYGTIKEPNPEIEKLITLAGNYADDFDNPIKIDQLDDISKKTLSFIKILSSEKEPMIFKIQFIKLQNKMGFNQRIFLKFYIK